MVVYFSSENVVLGCITVSEMICAVFRDLTALRILLNFEIWLRFILQHPGSGRVSQGESRDFVLSLRTLLLFKIKL